MVYSLFVDGEVKVKVNDHEFGAQVKPIAANYVSFSSWKQSPMEVFFNCTTQVPPKNFTLSDLIYKSFHPNATVELGPLQIDHTN